MRCSSDAHDPRSRARHTESSNSRSLLRTPRDKRRYPIPKARREPLLPARSSLRPRTELGLDHAGPTLSPPPGLANKWGERSVRTPLGQDQPGSSAASSFRSIGVICWRHGALGAPRVRILLRIGGGRADKPCGPCCPTASRSAPNSQCGKELGTPRPSVLVKPQSTSRTGVDEQDLHRATGEKKIVDSAAWSPS